MNERDNALEEAAKLCDGLAERHNRDLKRAEVSVFTPDAAAHHKSAVYALLNVATAIRSLKTRLDSGNVHSSGLQYRTPSPALDDLQST